MSDPSELTRRTISPSAEQRISLLESRVRTLSRANAALLLVGVLAALSAFAGHDPLKQVLSIGRDSVLTLRGLSIVDDRGVERVRVAAPLPDPIMLGRRFSRGEKVSGMMIYDGEGNERGGYITDESRSAALTLDEINRAAVHIGVNDRGEAHISLSNGRGGYGLFGMRPTGTFISLDGKSVATTSDTQSVSSAQLPPISTALSDKPITTLTRHRAGVTSVKFSPDARALASADLAGSIILWRTSDWTPLRTLSHGVEVYSTAFSPDGKTLASTGADSVVAIWDVGTGKKQRSFRYDDRALSVEFDATGDLLVGTEKGVLHIVDVARGAERRTLRTGGSIWAVTVSADQSSVATGLPLRVWDYKTLTLRAKPPAFAQLGVAFSADGKRLASAESTGGALLWTIADSLTYMPLRLTVEKRANGSRGPERFNVNMPAASIDLSADGTRVVAGGTNADVYLWSVPRSATTAGDPMRLAGHSMTVTTVALSRSADLVASGSLDRTVRIWRWPTN